MSTNPTQPNSGNRDNKPGQSSSAGRDDSSRSARPGSDSASQGRSQGGSAEVLRYLDTIEENVSKCRTALGGSGQNPNADRSGTERQGSERQGSDRQSSDRQGSESSTRGQDGPSGSARGRSSQS